MDAPTETVPFATRHILHLHKEKPSPLACLPVGPLPLCLTSRALYCPNVLFSLAGVITLSDVIIITRSEQHQGPPRRWQWRGCAGEAAVGCAVRRPQHCCITN